MQSGRSESVASEATVTCSSVAIVAGSIPPVVSISWEPPKSPIDSAYCVLFSDVDPDDDDSADTELVCMHCLVDDHPEIGRGLDIAREYGIADLDDEGQWVVGDLSRLEGD